MNIIMCSKWERICGAGREMNSSRYHFDTWEDFTDFDVSHIYCTVPFLYMGFCKFW